MTQYKLHYFNARGRAELVRLLFAAAGQEYEDVRIEKEQWPSVKATFPTGQVPALEVHENGHVYKFSQSVAIARFLAKRFNLAGTTDLEQAEVDMYVDQVTDFLNQLVKVHYETDEVKKAELAAKLQTEVIPTHMKIFETKLTQTNTGHLVGASLTLADIYLFAILDSTAEKSAAILEHFPSVKKLAETVKAMPHVAKWLESRPVTAM